MLFGAKRDKMRNLASLNELIILACSKYAKCILPFSKVILRCLTVPHYNIHAYLHKQTLRSTVCSAIKLTNTQAQQSNS